MSELIGLFQQNLAFCLSSCSSSLSYSKIADSFDGRLFAFAIYQLSQSSSKIRFDSNTIDITTPCLILLKLPTNENLFHDVVKQLIQSKHIIISSVTFEKHLTIDSKQKITKISNRFLDIYLKPILSTNTSETFTFVNPEESYSIRYDGIVDHAFVFLNLFNSYKRDFAFSRKISLACI